MFRTTETQMANAGTWIDRGDANVGELWTSAMTTY
jgi:hypothetical protein